MSRLWREADATSVVIVAATWPLPIGLLLLAASIASIFFFHMVPLDATDPQKILQKAFTLVLIPLPLSIAGVALISDSLAPSDDNQQHA